MRQLETHLRLDDSIPKSKNLVGRFTPEDLEAIGEAVWEGYDLDQQSRSKWLTRVQAAMDLALQLQKAKSFPWPDCANVAFPLVTIAAVQFHARAYPALVGREVVSCTVPGPDPQGVAKKRAVLVGRHMTYQVLEEDEAWEEQHDRLLLQLPIVGCAFKKSQYIPAKGHNISRTVPAVNLVMDYNATSVEAAARKTEIMPLWRNEVHARCLAGTWRNITEEAWFKEPAKPLRQPGQDERDKRLGVSAPKSDDATSFDFLEQHCYFDFDQDGYAEPYIVTIESASKCVVRIVARWESPADVERTADGKVIRIRSTEMYTKYGLIPSPDGGIYDVGFGILLGPLNESVNSLVNMLLDAGTMSTAAGGFLSRGAKIRGGTMTFSPFQWNRVDATGEDLSKSMLPLPVREPSAVLFNLLSFLVNYVQRISSSTDAMVGENPGQNTPASTQQSMLQEGQRIYSSLFKRSWRSMKEEFRKLYILNGLYLPVEKTFGEDKIKREDYLGDPSQVRPAADPNVISDQMRLQVAAAVAQRADLVLGYDKDAVEKNLLQAMRVEGAESLFPGGAKPGPSEKMQIEMLKQQGKSAIEGARLQFEKLKFIAELMEEQKVNTANIANLEAQAAEHAANADAEGAYAFAAMINTMLTAAKHRQEVISGRIDQVLKGIELHHAALEADLTPAVTVPKADDSGDQSLTAVDAAMGAAQ